MYTIEVIQAASEIYIPCGYENSRYVRSSIVGVGWKHEDDDDVRRNPEVPLQKRSDAFMLELVNRPTNVDRVTLVAFNGDYLEQVPA